MTDMLSGAARRAVRIMRAGALLAILAGVMVLAAGCGGSSSSSTSQEPSADAADAAALKYANCMRSHGITNFPEPNSQGQPQSGPPIDIGSPQYLAAEKACARYGVGGGNASPGVSTQVMQELLKYVACMRSHGVPDMPDPNSNGTLTLPTSGSANASSPQFQSAEQACQKLLPAQGGGS